MHEMVQRQLGRRVPDHQDFVTGMSVPELYGVDFLTLARWAGLDAAEEQASAGASIDESLKALVRLVLQLDASQRTEVASGV
jgi:hypothetical protein